MANLKIILAFSGSLIISYLLFAVLFKHKNKEMVEVMRRKDKNKVKELKKSLQDESWSWQNMLISKWVAFGGGFYGVMAVLTYAVVECQEIYAFFTSEQSFLATLYAVGFGDVFDLFLNSIFNFITAIIWPVFWMKRIEVFPVWIWFLVVYSGFLVGQYIAKTRTNLVNNERL